MRCMQNRRFEFKNERDNGAKRFGLGWEESEGESKVSAGARQRGTLRGGFKIWMKRTRKR